ncbi:hypothetical protein FA15DRAFT_675094 [Coprinopsis marcescibilis]|uniref:Uncharacterized protein n=1 Tax=Coprinopsis marcescibilis TaxID=230819 RepID=A0A5C3KFY1_COPMA|nr:hypothetical protein FA15DRAFT_675094 [Coprinopsis marcescibilis]
MSSPSTSDNRPVQRSVSSSTGSEFESLDWDRSVIIDPEQVNAVASTSTPRNSVIFPQGETTPGRPTHQSVGQEGRGRRTLSDLLKLHAEKGTTCAVSQEEANRLEDVLGQWINSSSSPYEGDDDFFVRGKDDMYIPSKRIESLVEGRQRGMSESISSSRPPSSAGFSNS